MSDRSENLSKEYERRVLEEEQPRSIGLFPIPEYPELEADRGMWSAALDIILTTLRYLAPATLLTLFWSQQSFLFKILKHIDSALRAIIFSSEEQKKDVLQWLAEAGPVTVEHLDTVWRHGWILCGVLDAKLPGACAGHSPTRLSLKHAQAIAEQYLGVEPIFSRQELESSDSLSRHQEWKLATYLDRIREALNKLTPPVSKPNTQRTSPETTQFTLDYVAGGSGLSAAQINNKMFFKIYPTAQQSIDPGEITILIRGPKDTYGMTVVPPVLGKAQLIRQKLLGLQPRSNYTENSLPITQGVTYLRNYGRNDMNKTYFIPKTTYDIKIDVESKPDCARVGYTVPLEGTYEISITSRGMNIVSSPYTVKASKDIIRTLERHNSYCENGEEIDIIDIETNRKVIIRIVDFVTEKMLLKENGSLEKISDDEAMVLMATQTKENKVPEFKFDMYDDDPSSATKDNLIIKKSKKFKLTVINIMRMIQVCKILKDFGEKQLKVKRERENCIQTYNQNVIPDIVNVTLGNRSEQPFILQDKRDKFIVPPNISVSIRNEKPKTYYEQKTINTAIIESTSSSSEASPDNLHQYSILQENESEEDNAFVDVAATSSNPVLSEAYEQNYTTQKELGVFVSTEYETNNSQNEEMQPVKIMVEDILSYEGENSHNNPFFVPSVERPKTPILKIISGEIDSRKTPVYVDPKLEHIIEKEIENESFLNPFHMHEHCKSGETGEPMTDFIIGAPVSLPPNISVPSSDSKLESIMNIDAENSTSVYSTPLHTIRKETDSKKLNNTSLNIRLQDTKTTSKSEFNNTIDTRSLIEAVVSKIDTTPKKDTWDSAYVSIDDNNFSPDGNNNNDNISYETHHKHLSSKEGTFELSPEDLSNMGPAEIEIWSCELNNLQDDVKAIKKDFKIFSPIYEESERNTSTGVKDSIKRLSNENLEELDPVTVAFAELNTVYQEIFPYSEYSSIQTLDEDVNKLHNKELQYSMENNNVRVDSASEIISDVKRHAKEFEGEISEVQVNVTESGSVSQTLQDDKDESIFNCNNKSTVEIKFGDESNANLVQERKQYFDEQTSETEITLAENKAHYKKKRLSSKNLKLSDSLTKRKGKQIVKNLLKAAENDNEKQIKKRYPLTPQVSRESESEVNLVEKWKQYWDTKLQMESEISKSTNKILKSKPPTKKEHVFPFQENVTEETVQVTRDIQTYKAPMKQELPEEVYKAFETSPKTFFGTSRKQILNKIDSFSGKPNTVNKSLSDVSTVFPDTGLVSSRVSLFHSISKEVEDRLWQQRKSQSMHNIYQRKDIDKKSAGSSEDMGKTNEQLHENVKCEIESIESLNLGQNNDAPERNEVLIDEKVNTDNTEKFQKISVREKRNLFVEKFRNKSFDEATLYNCKPLKKLDAHKHRYVKRTIREHDEQKQSRQTHSKSEMDIFNKVTRKASLFKTNENIDAYKSCEDLPKINVKNFISLYENVTKTAAEPKPVNKMSRTRTNSSSSPKQFEVISLTSEADNKPDITHYATGSNKTISTQNIYHEECTDTPDLEPKSQESQIPDLIIVAKTCADLSNAGECSDDNKDNTYLSLSDIDLEIVEKVDCTSVGNSPERELKKSNSDYKSRFKMAKEFFQSLEELRDVKRPPKLNECQRLLYQNKSTESPGEKEETNPKKRAKKLKKSNSMPSSEICRIWNQLQESQQGTSNDSKYVKISEKFNIDDLFTDVMEGKLSRQGSLRGIPHMKAVLETFKSMENLFDNKLSPYEMAVTQLNDFAKEKRIKNSQTYLTEYPYLPTTDPSKCHSRSDATASGLISMKEVLRRKPRRNSDPYIRLNPSFIVDL